MATVNAGEPYTEPSAPTTITYNGNEITALEAGQTATLTCAGKIAITDIVIDFGAVGNITYNGEETAVDAGKTATLACNGKKMVTDVVVSNVSALEQLATPTITLDGDTLTVTDTSGIATEFAILVDGVEMATVGVN